MTTDRDFMNHARAIRERYEASTTPEAHAARLRAKFARYRAERDEALTKAASSAQTEEPVMTCKKCGEDKVASLMSTSNGKPRNLCKSCDAERSAEAYALTKAATSTQTDEDESLTKSATSTQTESWSERVDRHHREMRGRAWFRGLPVPHDANDDQPTGQAQGWYMEVSNNSRYVTREVAFQIARLAGDDSVVTITRDSLAEAVGRVKNVKPNAATDMGLKDLEKRGWIKRDGQTIYLTVGDPTTPIPDLGWTYVMPADRFPDTERTKKKRTKKDGPKFELSGTWLSDAEMDAHIRSCYTQCALCDGDVR